MSTLTKEEYLQMEVDELKQQVELLQKEIQYFVDRCEGKHPDGKIYSRKTYERFKKVLEATQ